jgi:probable O-glycosylation ligase (exosortase A-associated)
MVVMVCLGLGFHGIIDGLKFLSSGGVHNVHGLIKFGDNNHYAVLMVMVIPLTIYLSRYLEQRLLRLAANGATILLIAAVIGTNSRGGLISLLAMGGWLVMTSRQKLAGLMMFVAGGLLVLAMAPESWFQRMDTIKEADEDSSFMSRIEAWQVSSAIALARPVTGGGLHAVQVQSVWNQYKGQTGLLPFVSDVPTSEVFRAAHSIYFEVLGDTGFIGLLLFVLIMLRGLRNGREMERAAARAPERFGWAVDLSRSLSAVVFSFMVGGASVSLAYYEILYIVIMLTEVLRRTVLAEVSGPIQARRVHVPH